MEYLDIKSRIERISREITELKKILILENERYYCEKYGNRN